MDPVNSAASSDKDAVSVFLSYARADRKRALPVITALKSAGFRVWWDGLLEGGENFLPTTEAALEAADAVVVLWSAAAIDSHWVRDEATRGRDRGCLVPLSIDGSQPPLGFRQFQVIDISRWRGRAAAVEFEPVIRAVGACGGGSVTPPARLAAAAPVSRRGLLIGGAAVGVIAAGGLAAWGTGLIGGSSAKANSIAIIPFRNLSGDPAQTYLSDGISAELRATLSRNRMLRIAAPTSSSEFRDQSGDVLSIAKALGVAFVLRGSVRRDLDRLRVSVELISGRDASVEWTQRLDRQLEDVFALESEIAAVVAKSLSAELTAQSIASGQSGDRLQLGGTAKVAAFDAYLRGKALADASQDEATDRAALAKFDAAIALDADYAAALAARSKILAAIANETGQIAEIPRLYDQSISSARRAIKAAPDLAEAHSALGYAIYNGRLDPTAAREAYDRSRALGGGDADVLRTFALYCAYTDRAADAAEAIKQSLSLDPLNPGAFRGAGYIAYASRDYPRTIAMMRKALALNPKLSTASAAIGNALYLSGKTDEALAAYTAEPLSVFKLQGLAIVRRKAGDIAGSEAAMAQMIAEYGSNSSYQQAQVLAQWGDTLAAMAQLNQAARTRDAGLLLARTDPLLDPLRADPKFAELLSAQGLS